MAISPENKRLSIVLPKDLHDEVIIHEAEESNRSVSNLLATLIMKHYENEGKYPIKSKSKK